MDKRDVSNADNLHRQGEAGFIMVITLLVLVVLTVLCLAALDNSTFEVQVAANDRQSRVAFNLADGGVYAAGKLLSEALESTDQTDPADYSAGGLLTYVDTSDKDSAGNVLLPNAPNDFAKRVFGTPVARPNPYGYDFRLEPPGGKGRMYLRIIARDAETLAGGGAEFAASSTGTGGGGSSGGTAVTLDVLVDAYSFMNTKSTIEARYRKVLGTAGGL